MKNLLWALLNRILFLILCIILIFCSDRMEFEFNIVVADENIPVVNNIDNHKEPVITDLGIPSLYSYAPSFFNAHNPWDMVVIDGQLYVGAGDYGLNSGDTNVYKYDIVSGTWLRATSLSSEAISKFTFAGGAVFAPGIDPIGNSEIGCYYVYSDGRWIGRFNLPDAAHNYDITDYDGTLFFAVGTWENAGVSPIKKSNDGGKTYTDVPFLKDGHNICYDCSYSRVYDFFKGENELYAVAVVYGNDGSREFSVYKYNNGSFEYHFDLLKSGTRNVYIWQDIIGAKASFDGKYFFTTGYLYSTEDFVSYEEIKMPDGGSVTDLFVENSGGEEILYILSTVQNDDGKFTSTIWKYTKNDINKIVSFTDTVGALSFVKYQNCFFTGLGRNGATDSRVGTVIKIEL